jgi:hypothetical protein
MTPKLAGPTTRARGDLAAPALKVSGLGRRRAGKNEGSAHPLAHFVENRRHGGRRRADDRQVDRLADRGQRRKCRPVENRGVIRVDREKLALEATGKQVLIDGAAQRFGLRRGADQGYRLGRQQRPQIMAGRDHGASLLQISGMLQCGKVVPSVPARRK